MAMPEEKKNESKNISIRKNVGVRRPTHLNITINIPLRNDEELSDVLTNFKKKILKPHKRKHRDEHNSIIPSAIVKPMKRKKEGLDEDDVSKEKEFLVVPPANFENNSICERLKFNHATQHSPSNGMEDVGSYKSFITNLTNHQQDTDSNKTISISQPTQLLQNTSKCDEMNKEVCQNYRKHKEKSKNKKKCMENKVKRELNTSFLTGFSQLQLNNKNLDLPQNEILNEQLRSHNIKTKSVQTIIDNQNNLDVKCDNDIDTQSVMPINNKNDYVKNINVLHDPCIENRNRCNTTGHLEKPEKNINKTNKIENNVSVKDISDYAPAIEINQKNTNISGKNDRQVHLQIVEDINETNKIEQPNKRSLILFSKNKGALSEINKDVLLPCENKKVSSPLQIIDSISIKEKASNKVMYPEDIDADKKKWNKACNAPINNMMCDTTCKEKAVSVEKDCKRKEKTIDVRISTPKEKSSNNILKRKEEHSTVRKKNNTELTYQQDGFFSDKNDTSDHSNEINRIAKSNYYNKNDKKRKSEEVSTQPSRKRKEGDDEILPNNNISTSLEYQKSNTEKCNIKENISIGNLQNEIELIDISKTEKSQSQNKKKAKATICNRSIIKKVKTKTKKYSPVNEDSSGDEEKDFAGIMEYLKEYVGNEDNFTVNVDKLKNCGRNKSSKITSNMKSQKLNSSDSSSDSSLSAYTTKLSKSCQDNKKLSQNKTKGLYRHHSITKVEASDLKLNLDMVSSKNKNNEISTTAAIAENKPTPKKISNGKNNIEKFLQKTTNPQQSKIRKDSGQPEPSAIKNTNSVIKIIKSDLEVDIDMDVVDSKRNNETSSTAAIAKNTSTSVLEKCSNSKYKYNIEKFLQKPTNPQQQSKNRKDNDYPEPSKTKSANNVIKIIKSDPDMYIEVEETKIHVPEIKENEQIIIAEKKISRNKQEQPKESRSLENVSKCNSSQNTFGKVDKRLCNGSDSNLKRKLNHSANDFKRGKTKANPDPQRLVCNYFDRVLNEKFQNREKPTSRSVSFILNSDDSSSDDITAFKTEKRKKDSDVEKRKTKMLEIISYADDHTINILEKNEELRKLDINISWDVPISHTIETRISSCPTKSQQQLFRDLNIKLKNGPFTKIEDEIIKKNFQDFCKQYGLSHDPTPFLNFQYGNINILNAKQRIHFGRYLGKGLVNRKLYCIYSRFKILYSTFTKGRFTPEEDAVISEYMTLLDNNKKQYSMLSKLLNRPRCLIEKRHKLLQRNTEMLYPKDYARFVEQLMDVTKSKSLEDLKCKEITNEHWIRISKKMNIHQHHLKVCWKSSLYTKLFHDGPIPVDKIMRKLINMLDKNEEDDYRKLNWTKLVESFDNVTREFLYRMFRKTIISKVPPHLHTNLRKCVLYLKKVYSVNTLVMSDINKIHIDLEYDS